MGKPKGGRKKKTELVFDEKSRRFVIYLLKPYRIYLHVYIADKSNLK